MVSMVSGVSRVRISVTIVKDVESVFVDHHYFH